MNEIKTFTTKGLPFSNSISGLYKELLISCTCSENIYVVDRLGRKTRVESTGTTPKASAYVSISIRKANGLERRGKNNGAEQEVEVQTLTFPYIYLEQGPFFVEEVDLLFSNQHYLDGAVHPRMMKNKNLYWSKLENINELEDIIDHREFPTLRVFANDTSGIMREAWIYLAGSVCRIKVTCCPYQDSGIYYLIKQKGEIIHEFMIELKEIDSEEPISLRNGSVLFIARTRRQLLEKVSFMTDNYTRGIEFRGVNAIPMELHDKEMAEWKRSVSEMSSIHKQEMDAAKEERDLEIKQLKNKLEKAEQDRKAADLKANEWKSLYEANSAYEKEKHSKEQEEAKAKKEQASAKTERAKTIGTWIRSLVPVVLAVVEFVFCKLIFKKTKAFA